MGCAQNDWQIAVSVSDILEKIEAVVFAQSNIQNDEVGSFLLNKLYELGAVTACDHIISLLSELIVIEYLDRLLIIHNKDPIHVASQFRAFD